MAKQKKPSTNWRSINNRLDVLDAQMRDVYKNTFNTDINNSFNLSTITDDIMDSIDALIANDSDIQGIPNVSRLYNRLNSKKNNGTVGEFTDDVFSIFDDKAMVSNLMDVYSKSRSIKQIDEQIDTVCKYMPKLQDALDIKKDSVLVAETFTKDYLNLISGLNKDDKDFSSRVLALKEKYQLEDLLDEIVARTEKYGECFVYRVPYKKAFEKMLDKKSGKINSRYSNPFYSESVIVESGRIMNEGLTVNASAPQLSTDASGTFKITMHSGIISEVVDEYNAIKEAQNKLPKGLYEQFLIEMAINEAVDQKIAKNKKTSADTEIKEDNVKFSKLVPDEVDYSSELDRSASDGFIDAKNGNRNNAPITVKGCLVKILERANVFPICVEGICLGYYYIKYIPDQGSNNMLKNSVVTGNTKQEGNAASADDDKMLKYICGKIANKIDATFINANGDLAKEIYMMLKYDTSFNAADPNGNLDITFIPAEDMHHHYYRLDPVTHRGISDLHDGLIPATIWCMITLCTSVGIVTRGQDKRVYYVQQSGVETNVAKTLMNVVNQIKKGNFGVRQLESINNILGIVGRFNDYVVPTGPNGEAPIRFETMQAQNIETPIDLLTQMEENAINPTGVPIELINATKGLDYAVHYTISNSKFMTIIQKRQAKEQIMDSELITSIYNCEYGENTVIKIMLPAPKFITMANSNSVIDNAKVYAQNLTEIFGYDLNDQEKAEFTALAIRHFVGSHVDVGAIDNMKSLARVNVATKSTGEDQQ